MRSIAEYAPDVQICTAGAPSFIVMHALARATADFLNRSEAWKEWTCEVDPVEIESGTFAWEEHIVGFDWLAIKRVEMIHWGSDDCVLRPRVASKVAGTDREWRTRVGRPACFVQEGDGGGSVRFVPMPDPVTLPESMTARLVLVTEVNNGLTTSERTAQIPQLPDKIFHRHRSTIVAGALAILYAIPNRDWTNLNQVGFQRDIFDNAIILAASDAARDYSNAPVVVQMDPYWR